MAGERFTRWIPEFYARTGAGRWLRSPVGESAYLTLFFAYKRFVEDPFAALASRHPWLFHGGDILDVGANSGYTATVFAGAIERGHKVYAFEPEPENVRRLKHVIARRRLGEIIVPVAAAVSDRDGEVDLIVNPSHPGDHRIGAPVEGQRAIRVRAHSIDSFVEDQAIGPVRFVKIDVQGAELAVSRGMARLIDRSPDIVVAFERSASDDEAVPEFYRSRGFTLHLLTRDALLPLATPHAEACLVKRRGYFDILATRQRLEK